jgi:hypothetical protein
MRVIGTEVHNQCHVTYFHWNNRYLIKLEAGPFEQTFKIEEYNLTSEADLKKIVDESFISQAMIRFEEMASSLAHTLEKLS